MSKDAFKKSMELQRKLALEKTKEIKAQLDMNNAEKMIQDMMGNIKRITNQKRHIMEAFYVQREEERKQDKREQLKKRMTALQQSQVGDNIVRVSEKMRPLW